MDEMRISERIEQVLEKITHAAQSAGRSQSEVRLVVVTKGQPPQVAAEVFEAGIKDLGENYIEEALVKMAAVQPGQDIRWHMIGHVQSRKAQSVCEHFDLLHSLDSSRLAERLDRFAGELGRTLPVLLECNLSGEASKSGWPAWDETTWSALLPEIEMVVSRPHLQVRGLMTMPPYSDEAEASRPFFKQLRCLQEFLASRFPQAQWNELSMGMSGDFEVAVKEGATLVRVGTAIVGPRPRKSS